MQRTAVNIKVQCPKLKDEVPELMNCYVMDQ